MSVLITCPICGASVSAEADVPLSHIGWHDSTGTLCDWTLQLAVDAMRDRQQAAGRIRHGAPAWTLPADDAPTAKLPPVGQTVRRRPPVPNVRELRGRELLLALAEELRDDEDHPICDGCNHAMVSWHDGARGCTWPGCDCLYGARL